MRTLTTRLIVGRLLAVVAAIAVVTGSSAHAAVVSYSATLNGASESPPNGSAGIGAAQVDIDAVANTMRVRVTFGNLTGTSTASHIHAPTAVAGTGTAGVATTTPTFAAFPLGVTSGAYDMTLDMTQASSYNPVFVTANGGTTASAEVALFQSIADGTAYLNIHSTVFPGGEIRGFLIPGIATSTRGSSWGRIKDLYR